MWPRVARVVVMSRHQALLVVGVLLAVAWVGVLVAGGTRTAFPHLFYFPVVAAGALLGGRGGAVVGVVAMVLCGPGTPLDVAAGVPQSPGNWLVRGAFFVTIGALTGASVRGTVEGMEHTLARRLHGELTGDLHARACDGAVTAERVREVLARGGLSTVFQPIYELDGGGLVAVEALTRFPDPAASPAVWFAQAAAADLHVELERAAIATALCRASGLPEQVAVSVNVSPAALCDPGVAELLCGHRGRPVVVEITEHAIVDDYGMLDDALSRLRAVGIRVAVDDAGAGFASLQHVLRLAPDILKLDISLTQNVRDDHVRRAMASALVRFARDTGTMLIAEGVETHADLNTWRDLGADAVQGYLLGRPADLPLPEHAPALLGRATVPFDPVTG